MPSVELAYLPQSLAHGACYAGSYRLVANVPEGTPEPEVDPTREREAVRLVNSLTRVISLRLLPREPPYLRSDGRLVCGQSPTPPNGRALDQSDYPHARMFQHAGHRGEERLQRSLVVGSPQAEGSPFSVQDGRLQSRS
jgi:hypothetical protein